MFWRNLGTRQFIGNVNTATVVIIREIRCREMGEANLLPTQKLQE